LAVGILEIGVVGFLAVGFVDGIVVVVVGFVLEVVVGFLLGVLLGFWKDGFEVAGDLLGRGVGEKVSTQRPVEDTGCLHCGYELLTSQYAPGSQQSAEDVHFSAKLRTQSAIVK